MGDFMKEENIKKLIESHKKFIITREKIDDNIFIYASIEEVLEAVINHILLLNPEISESDYHSILKKKKSKNDDLLSLINEEYRMTDIPRDSLAMTFVRQKIIIKKFEKNNYQIITLLKSLEVKKELITKELKTLTNKINDKKMKSHDFTSELTIRSKLTKAMTFIDNEKNKIEYIRDTQESICKLYISREFLESVAYESSFYNYTYPNLKEKIDSQFDYVENFLEIIANHLKPRTYDLASRITKTSKHRERLLEEARSKDSNLRSKHIVDGLRYFENLFLTRSIKRDELNDFINSKNIVSNIEDFVRDIYAIKNKNLIIEALNSYKIGQFSVFINSIVILIESLLEDSIAAMKLFEPVKETVLRQKVELIFGEQDFEWYKYFRFDLNYNRNSFAHGNKHIIYEMNFTDILSDEFVENVKNDVYTIEDSNVISSLLLLDYESILYNCFKNTEEKSIINFIEKCYMLYGSSRLDNSALENIVLHSIGDDCIKWIINPIYNKVYDFYDEVEPKPKSRKELKDEILEILISPIFWEYMYEKYSVIHYFGDENEMKSIYKINSILGTICNMDETVCEKAALREILKKFKKI